MKHGRFTGQSHECLRGALYGSGLYEAGAVTAYMQEAYEMGKNI